MGQIYKRIGRIKSFCGKLHGKYFVIFIRKYQYQNQIIMSHHNFNFVVCNNKCGEKY